VALGKVNEALPHAQRAHELNPSEAATHQTYYNTLIRRGDYRAALEELDEFLRLFPRHPLAEKARAQREALSKEVARRASN
jgi:tetratricopeptide (TPR) repeat protein